MKRWEQLVKSELDVKFCWEITVNLGINESVIPLDSRFLFHYILNTTHYHLVYLIIQLQIPYNYKHLKKFHKHDFQWILFHQIQNNSLLLLLQFRATGSRCVPSRVLLAENKWIFIGGYCSAVANWRFVSYSNNAGLSGISHKETLDFWIRRSTGLILVF